MLNGFRICIFYKNILKSSIGFLKLGGIRTASWKKYEYDKAIQNGLDVIQKIFNISKKITLNWSHIIKLDQFIQIQKSNFLMSILTGVYLQKLLDP